MILNILETNGKVVKTAENIKYLTTDQKVSGLNPDGVTKTTVTAVMVVFLFMGESRPLTYASTTTKRAEHKRCRF